MDTMSAIFMTFGVIMILAGWVQLLIISFKNDYSWGLTTLFLPPISYLYALVSWDKAQGAMVMTIIGWVLVLFGL